MELRKFFGIGKAQPEADDDLHSASPEARLYRLLERYDLGRLHAVLSLHALPATGIRFVEEPQGRSRLGGSPELAEKTPWPEHAGRPLDFLLQLDLAEVHAHELWNALPERGLLGFFYDLERRPWGFNPDDATASRVIYTPPELDTAERPAPGGGTGIASRGVELFPVMTFPQGESTSFEKFETAAGLTTKETGRYLDLLEAFDVMQYHGPDTPHHRFAGHSENIQGDMQFEAELVRHGFNTGEGTHYEEPRALEHKNEADDWRLLLQLDSDPKAGLTWGDLGMLYFWLRDDDAIGGDWSHVWTAVQCT